MKPIKIFLPDKTVAYNGALVAISAVFFYSMIAMGYVIIRSSANIYSIMPRGERNGILLVNGFSVAYSVAVFSLLLAIISSVGGAVASVILKRFLLYFNPEFNFRKAIFISCMTSLSLLSIVYVLLYSIMKDRMTIKYVETFLFWFILPAMLCFVVCIIGGSKLNSIFVKIDQP